MAIRCPKCNADNPDASRFCGDCGTQLSSLEHFDVTDTIDAPKAELAKWTTLKGVIKAFNDIHSQIVDLN